MAIIAIACVAAIAGAGVVIYQTFPGLLPSKTPAAKGSNVAGAAAKRGAEQPKEDSSSWSHSRLVVVRSAPGGDKRPVVMLGYPDRTDRTSETSAGFQTDCLPAS